VLRAFVVRAGRLTGQGDDLFHLYLQELLDLLRGNASALEQVPVRRATYERPSITTCSTNLARPVRIMSMAGRDAPLLPGQPVSARWREGTAVNRGCRPSRPRDGCA
jgi:pyruvate,water dikinase